MSPPGQAPPGAGRRRGSPDTRAAILAVARQEFADKGYDKASVRGIARAAEVDPALVHHYFGAKDALFVAALELPLDPRAVSAQLVAGDRAELGERLVRLLLSVWSHPVGRAPLMALLRSAMTHERAADMLRGFLSRALVARLADAVALPDAELRAELAASQLVGLAIARYVVRLEPLASLGEDQVVAIIAPTIQRYLTGDLAGP